MNNQERFMETVRKEFLPEMEKTVNSNEFQEFTSKERFDYLVSYTEMRYMNAFDQRGEKF